MPLPVPVDQLVACPPDQPKLAAWLMAQGFRSILTRLGLDGGPQAQPARKAAQVDAAQAARTAAEEAAAGFGPYETVSDGEALSRWIARAHEGGMVAIHGDDRRL